jgi:hypothetical protein
MTKIPGEVEPFKPRTKEQRDALKAFRRVEANQAITDHEIAQKAFHSNHERLKAERLAREAAAGTSVAAKKAKPTRKRQVRRR